MRNTVDWSIPPGRPARPLISLLMVSLASLFILTLSGTLGVGTSLVLATFGVLWTFDFCGNWVFNQSLYDGSRPGTCPHCKQANRIWPWTW